MDKYVHDLDHIINFFRKRWKGEWLEDVWSAKWFRSKVAQAMRETYQIHEEETLKPAYNREALIKPYAILYQFIDSMLEIYLRS